MTDQSRIPLFPLNAVLFPGGRLPLRVFEARYMDMTRDCMRSGSPFGVCLIREGREVGKPATPEPVGSLAHIIDWDMQQLGMLQLQTRGGQRFRVLRSEASPQGLLSADIELIPAEDPVAVPESLKACVQLLQTVVRDQGDTVFHAPHRMDEAAWVGYRLAEILPIPLPARQKLLELADSVERLTLLHRFLEQHGLLQNNSGGA
ncbi:MAG: peptidase S16 [Betaproteobacteria bacterium]|nr:peptidase S16 [Betaproteobacteria bacterium]